MMDIIGPVVIILKDGLGLISGEAVGARRAGKEDFIVLASGGEFTADGALIDNQVNVGKIQHLLLGDTEVIAFSGNTLDSAYLVELPAEDQDGPEPAEPTRVAEMIVTTRDLPTIASSAVDLAVEDGSQDGPVEQADGQGEPAAEDQPAGAVEGVDGGGQTASDDEATTTENGDDQMGEDPVAAAAAADQAQPAPDEASAAKKAPRAKKTA